MFDFSADVRRLIYTVERYHHQLRKVIKNNASFPNSEDARKSLLLATHDIVKKQTTPISNWAHPEPIGNLL